MSINDTHNEFMERLKPDFEKQVWMQIMIPIQEI